MLKFCVALVALSLAAGDAVAGTVVDVDNLLVPPVVTGAGGTGASYFNTPNFSGAQPAMQTWTVTTTGRLAQLDLYGGASAAYSQDGLTFRNVTPDFDVTLSILRGGADHLPGDEFLGSVTFAAADIATLGVTSFDLSHLGIFADAGTVLTYRMDVEDCAVGVSCIRNWFNWSSFDGAGNTWGYEGGRTFVRSGSYLYEQFGDMNFRTWVTGVPEPATWGLMVLGFLTVGAAVRRRRLVMSPA